MYNILPKSLSLKQKVVAGGLALLLGGFIFLVGYNLKMQGKIKALTPAQKKVLVIGHAGRGFYSPLNPFNPYPANSMTSLLKAMAEGAQGLEVDVHLSQDEVPILYHDPRLNTMTSATGLIEEKPAKAVLGLPYQGNFFYDLFHQEKIIALEDLLREFQKYPEVPYLHLDLRQEGTKRPQIYARALLGLLRQYQFPAQKLTFISPDPVLLKAIQQEEPQATYLLDMVESFGHTLAWVQQHKLHGLVINSREMNAQKMQQARAHKLQVVLFGPKSSGSIYKSILLQPDAIEVNNVAAMAEMVR